MIYLVWGDERLFSEGGGLGVEPVDWEAGDRPRVVDPKPRPENKVVRWKNWRIQLQKGVHEFCSIW